METRTPDLLITNQLLYQLSYAGAIARDLDIHGADGRQEIFGTRYIGTPSEHAKIPMPGCSPSIVAGDFPVYLHSTSERVTPAP